MCPQTRSVFVVMPTDSDSDFFTKFKILGDVARENNWVLRAPSYSTKDPQFDLDETLENLNKSDLVLVDLSLERPSCYYELGLAEALRRPIRIISKGGTPIHQTTLRNQVITYSGVEEYEGTVRIVLR